MKHLLRLLPWAVPLVVSPAFAQSSDWRRDFKTPSAAYRPAPFWHMNGKLTTAELERQLSDVSRASGFGGVVVLPVTAQPGFGSGGLKPGMEPAYLSDAYFAHYETILKKAKSLGLQVIWYDDVDFPSGTAGGRMKKLFPNDTRKVLSRKDTTIAGGTALVMALPGGTPMATVAMNTQTKERVDLAASVSNGELRYTVPPGTWKVMAFTCQPSPGTGTNDVVVDYLDPQAVDKFFTLNHAEFYKRFPAYFGSTIRQLFFDDVGFFTIGKHGERTWTTRFNEAFKKRFGQDPALYYPALWEDIGPETSAARVAFFDTRAELLAEGFPRKSTEWAAQHGLQASGHPPGNYEIQPVDMNGDILKYYRHQPIPLMDLIFSYGHGREGYKLISSAATAYDRPVVAAEIYGAIAEKTMDPTLLYRAAMEVLRGASTS